MIESPCPDIDDHYCFHGVCFMMENRRFCRCSLGFEGHRCHFMSLRQRQDEPTAAPLGPAEPLLVLALMLVLVAAASLAAWAWCCFRFKRQRVSQAAGDLPGSGKQRLVALDPV
ncbi:proepiregulin [Petromyzon marinus]|uniref:proepiregulin n=1 Tax=Petromyzon marinus TaxID=7757 RepID=UPI003F708AA0